MASPRKTQSYVIDRHGHKVDVRFDRITARIQSLCNDEYYGPALDVIDPIQITKNVVTKFTSGITTKELDQLAIDDANEHVSHNEQYEYLAARLAITGFIHKETSPCIREATNALISDGYNEYSDEYVGIVNTYYDLINSVVDHRRDFRFRYFGFKTLLKYLKTSEKYIERPQHAYMRVAISLFCGTPDQRGHLRDDLRTRLEQAFEFYNGLSRHYYSCASPIILNAGTRVQQMSSCYLNPTGDDLSTLLDVFKDVGMISKWAGGIGVWLTSIRAEGAKIGSSGTATGIKHYVKMMNDLQLYVNQRGLRPGAFAMYLEPWHADIFTFLEVLPRTHNISFNASDLKYALWIPDNFMRALREPNGVYYLFSPDECKGLYNTHGAEFEENYNEYVERGLRGELRIFKQVKALEIFKAFFETVTQVGTPYCLFKDTANKLSNMKNVATICSSNLCVSGDTYVLTEFGQQKIKKLVNQKVNVWNGEQWSAVTIKKTGENQQLLRVTLSSGAAIECTPYHKFYDKKGQEIRAHELKPGTALEKVKSWPEKNIFPDENEILSVEPINGLHDTYCFNEPLRHRGIFNGVMTGNCAEILIPSWSAHDAELFGQEEIASEYGCCNLGAICLPSYVKNGKIDFEGLINKTRNVVRALDNVIDLNYYPAEAARRSNMRHRPIGIGVMGLADVFLELRLIYGSPEARKIDQAIAACIYFGAMLESSNLAAERGAYPSFTYRDGAPALHGILQPDLHVEHGYLQPDWEDRIAEITEGVLGKEEWTELRDRLKTQHLRNAYVTAYMPTASTANIVSCNESTEPFTSNIYKRSGNAGEFIITNKYLIRELEALGLWNDRIRKSIMLKRGSVQHLNIPEHVKKMFRTAWELDQRAIMVHAQNRGAFICQTQSMNLFHKELTMQKLLIYLLYAWQSGLKTGCYYNHTQPVDTTVQSALLDGAQDDEDNDEVTEEAATAMVCRRDDPTCTSCSV
jgi:ribonucleotide reductase alpha subunit